MMKTCKDQAKCACVCMCLWYHPAEGVEILLCWSRAMSLPLSEPHMMLCSVCICGDAMGFVTRMQYHHPCRVKIIKTPTGFVSFFDYLIIFISLFTHRICKYKCMRIYTYGHTSLQSFLAALTSELTEYYRLVAVLEAQQLDSSRSGTLTLKRLVVWTQDPLHRLKFLGVLVDGCKRE